MIIGRFGCPNGCGRSYKNKNGLSQHLHYECGVEPQFQCSLCGKMFKHRKDMRRHVVCKHNMIDKPF